MFPISLESHARLHPYTNTNALYPHHPSIMAYPAEEIIPLMLSREDSGLNMYPASLVQQRAPAKAAGETAQRRSWGAAMFERFRRQEPTGNNAGEDSHDKAKTGRRDLFSTLPLELMEEIASVECLSRPQLVALSMTCRSFRFSMWGTAERNISDALSHDDYLVFLSLLVGGEADKWLCIECNAIHAVRTTDTPVNPNGSSCPRATDWVAVPGAGGEPDKMAEPWLTTTGLHLFEYHLAWPHVQAALKYNRLRNLTRAQKSHFSKLMAPHRKNAHFGGLDDGKHEVYPKIVNERFLLLSTYSYTHGIPPLRLDHMNCIYVCPHLHTYGKYGWETLRVRLSRDGETLPTALRHALATRGIGYTGYCTECPIDFEVAVQKDTCTIRTWYDVGCESAVAIEGNWKTLSVDIRDGAPAFDQFSISHFPGSIRKAYGEEPNRSGFSGFMSWLTLG